VKPVKVKVTTEYDDGSVRSVSINYPEELTVQVAHSDGANTVQVVASSPEARFHMQEKSSTEER
jgi:hypothetical protein